MRWALAVTLALGLLAAGSASADHLDPAKRLRAEDQARARAIVVRAGDLGRGYRIERTSGLEPHITCRALDESDLVVTGQARSPYWSREYRLVSSAAAVYRTRSDSTAAWARSTGAAGLHCLRVTLTREIAQGEPVRATLRKMAFPQVAERTAAYRITLTEARGDPVPALVVDFVLLKRARAQAVLVFASLVLPPERLVETELARRIAARMAKAMRGA